MKKLDYGSIRIDPAYGESRISMGYLYFTNPATGNEELRLIGVGSDAYPEDKYKIEWQNDDETPVPVRGQIQQFLESEFGFAVDGRNKAKLRMLGIK